MKLFSRSLPLLIALTALSLSTWGQSNDFVTEWAASYSHTFHKSTEISVGEELRLKQYSIHFGKSETSFGVDELLFRKELKTYGIKLKIGASYDFIYKYNSKHYYEDVHRLNLNIGFTKKIGDWGLHYRLRYQTSFRNENIGSYKYNPKMYLRNRIGVSYTFPTHPWKIYATEECYQRLNHPKRRVVDEFCTKIGTSYKIDKHNTIDIYLKAANEVMVKQPDNYYAIGFGYEFD